MELFLKPIFYHTPNTMAELTNTELMNKIEQLESKTNEQLETINTLLVSIGDMEEKLSNIQSESSKPTTSETTASESITIDEEKVKTIVKSYIEDGDLVDRIVKKIICEEIEDKMDQLGISNMQTKFTECNKILIAVCEKIKNVDKFKVVAGSNDTYTPKVKKPSSDVKLSKEVHEAARLDAVKEAVSPGAKMQKFDDEGNKIRTTQHTKSNITVWLSIFAEEKKEALGKKFPHIYIKKHYRRFYDHVYLNDNFKKTISIEVDKNSKMDEVQIIRKHLITELYNKSLEFTKTNNSKFPSASNVYDFFKEQYDQHCAAEKIKAENCE